MSTIPSASAQEQSLVLYSTVRTRIQDALNKYQHGFCDRKGCKWLKFGDLFQQVNQLEIELSFVTFSKVMLRGNRNVLSLNSTKVGYSLTQRNPRPAISVNFWCKNQSLSFLSKPYRCACTLFPGFQALFTSGCAKVDSLPTQLCIS